MSLAREPLEVWEAERPRASRSLGFGALLTALYWLGAALAAGRAYELGYHRYDPRTFAADNPLAMTLARDAGLWAATATAAAALILFLAVLGVAQAAGRLLRARRGA